MKNYSYDLGRYRKGIAAALTALSVAVTDGILDLNDGLTMLIAVAGALGVYLIPNNPNPEDPEEPGGPGGPVLNQYKQY